MVTCNRSLHWTRASYTGLIQYIRYCSHSPTQHACVCLCARALMYFIFKHLSAGVPRSLNSQALTLTTLRSQPWKRQPLALFRDRSHSWCGSISIHTSMIIHSGVIVLHISPLARQSVTAAAGRTWVIQGSAALISVLRWRCWRGEGCCRVSLWL